VRYNSSKPVELGALAYAQGSEIHVAPGQERTSARGRGSRAQKQGRVAANTQFCGPAGMGIRRSNARRRDGRPRGRSVQRTRRHRERTTRRASTSAVVQRHPGNGGGAQLVAAICHANLEHALDQLPAPLQPLVRGILVGVPTRRAR